MSKHIVEVPVIRVMSGRLVVTVECDGDDVDAAGHAIDFVTREVHEGRIKPFLSEAVGWATVDNVEVPLLEDGEGWSTRVGQESGPVHYGLVVKDGVASEDHG